MKKFIKEIKDSILTKKFNRYTLNKMNTCLKLADHYYARYLYNAYFYGLDRIPHDEEYTNYYWMANYYYRKYKAWSNIQISLIETFLAKDWWWLI